jgi:hypothetical protein
MLDPVLLNPNFEDGFRFIGDSNANVAEGWYPFWKERTPEQPAGLDHKPEYKDCTEGDHAYGRHSQQWFTWSARHRGGIYQVVEGFTPGSKVRFRAKMQQWCMTSDNKDAPGQMHLQMGLDPTGGTDWFAETVQRGNGVRLRNYEWGEVDTPVVEIQGTQATVFIYSEPDYALRDNNAYVDNVVMDLVYVPEPEPGPNPPEPEPEQPVNMEGTICILSGDTQHLFRVDLPYCTHTVEDGVVKIIYQGGKTVLVNKDCFVFAVWS